MHIALCAPAGVLNTLCTHELAAMWMQTANVHWATEQQQKTPLLSTTHIPITVFVAAQIVRTVGVFGFCSFSMLLLLESNLICIRCYFLRYCYYQFHLHRVVFFQYLNRMGKFSMIYTMLLPPTPPPLSQYQVWELASHASGGSERQLQMQHLSRNSTIMKEFLSKYIAKNQTILKIGRLLNERVVSKIFYFIKLQRASMPEECL